MSSILGTFTGTPISTGRTFTGGASGTPSLWSRAGHFILKVRERTSMLIGEIMARFSPFKRERTLEFLF